ncbi:MAG: choice-of-anchor Q domain-containing protein [Gemmataceae bacterium]
MMSFLRRNPSRCRRSNQTVSSRLGLEALSSLWGSRNSVEKRARLNLNALEERSVPAVLTVTSSADSGTGTLRDALTTAASNGQADTIQFNSGVTSITLLSNLPQYTEAKDLTIIGNGSLVTTVDGNGYEMFHFNVASANPTISVKSVALINGSATQPYPAVGWGGAIHDRDESLIIDDVYFRGNHADFGGAIAIQPSIVTGSFSVSISNSTFYSNTGYLAPALYTDMAATTITNCIFSKNVSETSAGAIWADGNSSLTVNNSTFSENTSNFGGGGAILSYFETVTLNQCTFSGNAAPVGGALAIDSHSKLTLNNCTITDNHGNNAGGVSIAQNATVTFNSTIVAKNSAFTGVDVDFPGIIGGDYNLIGIVNDGGMTLNGTHNIFGEDTAPLDPLLGSLQNNGGTTFTHEPQSGSPAINRGSNPLGLTTDQRQASRSQDLATDIGAVEVHDSNPIAFASAKNVSTTGVTTFDVTVTYSDNAGVDTSTIDVNDLTVTGPGYSSSETPVNVSVSGSGTSVTATYTFDAPNGVFDFMDNGAYFVNLNSDVTDTGSHPVAAGSIAGFTCKLVGNYVVTNANDSGSGSLRQAIAGSNYTTGLTDTISFDASVFGTNSQTISLTTGQLSISDAVDIVGSGSKYLTIEADANSRHFAASVGTVNLSGMTLVGNSSPFGYTGGVTIAGAANLTDISIHDCRATTGGALVIGGGGSYFAPFTIADCSFTNNNASAYAGGVYLNAATGSITRTTIADNSATFSGGGLYLGNVTSFSIDRSTISGNSAYSGNGGGIEISGIASSSGYQFTNSTLSGNDASSGAGGAIHSSANSSIPLSFQYCTLTENTADTGGGISRTTGSGAVTLADTIMAGNVVVTSDPDLSFASATNVGGNHNLIGVADQGNFTLTGTNNSSLLGTAASPLDPHLGALANNGGPTKTHALLHNSGAIDQGETSPSSPSTDQRGTGYPRAYSLASTKVSDVGAYELQAPPGVSVTTNDPTQGSMLTSIIVTFTDSVRFDGNPADAFSLEQVWSGNTQGFVTLTASVNSLSTVVTLTFETDFTEYGQTISGHTIQTKSLIDGQYHLIIDASKITHDGAELDGNNNGVGGDNYDKTGDATNMLYRLFGDTAGTKAFTTPPNGTVTQPDDVEFRASFNTTNPTFDYDGDGNVDFYDFQRFRARFNVQVI